MIQLAIGFLGRARSGKSSSAEAVAAQAKWQGLIPGVYDIGALVLDFCISSGRLPPKKREDLKKFELDMMILVGRQQREKDEEFWLRRLMQKVEEDKSEVLLVPNVRYPNEVKFLRDMGGKLVRVVCLNEDGSVYISKDRDPNDVSETGLLGANTDYTIIAKRFQEGLVRAQAVTIYNHIRGELK